jgi:hypothetical protein
MLLDTTTSRILTFKNDVERNSLWHCSTSLERIQKPRSKGCTGSMHIDSVLTAGAFVRVVNIPLDPRADYRSELVLYYYWSSLLIDFAGLQPDLWEWYVFQRLACSLWLIHCTGSSQIQPQLLPEVASAQVIAPTRYYVLPNDC